MKEWYIIYNGTQQGPMPADQLVNFGLNPASMVWTAGMAEWRPASTCAELAIYLAGPAAGAQPTTPPPGASPRYEENIDLGAQQPQGGGYRQPDPNNPGNWANPNGGNSGFINGLFGTTPDPGYDRWSGKSKIVAGLFAIFLGYLGVQYFYCDKVMAGFISILLSLITCGAWSVVTLIQGIYMLTMTDRQFDDKYVYNHATFPLF
ncbi:MAG: GYF domain-containing protein [Muribaculaceae bacterium]|nr:GYF domain-containing protein [Muribaculaceae bacterium]